MPVHNLDASVCPYTWLSVEELLGHMLRSMVITLQSAIFATILT